MTAVGPNDQSSDFADAETVMTVRREQLYLGTEWVAAGRVRLSRRVVTEIRTIEVTLRREELVVETDGCLASDGVIAAVASDGPVVAAPTGPPDPVVVVLREELPEVTTRVHPYERVTVHVGLAQTERDVTNQVRSETVDVTVSPTP